MQLAPEVMVLGGLIIFSLVLNFVLLLWLRRATRHYNSLTKGIDKKSLHNVLEGIQKSLAEHEKNGEILKKELEKISDASLLHVQQVVLKRFNPFGDTGGDQSFILALLDGKRDGVVITSLHSRENTRFYVKSIKGGEGIDHPLSAEEQKLISRKGK